MSTIGDPFLEKPDLYLFNGDKSALKMTLDQLTSLGSSFTTTGGVPSVGDLTKTHHLLQTLKQVLLFRKEATFYGLGFDSEIDAVVDLIDDIDIPSYSTTELTTTFDPLRQNLITALGTLKDEANDAVSRPILNEILYFDYARNGENLLSQEVSRLGDALVLLSEVSKELNRMESILAINPGKRFLNERGELMITDNAGPTVTASSIGTSSGGSTNFFYNTTPFTTVERRYVGGTLTTLNAMAVLKDATVRLKELRNQLPSESDHYKALSEVLSVVDTDYDITTWNTSSESLWADRIGGREAEGELYWRTTFDAGSEPRNFARLYMDNEFRKAISDALSVIQSQNDIQKQILSKALFLYQEFIKSSAALLDMTFKCSKSVAQKIAR
ncbi:hypothetical protein [Candidatus Similichlamydia laticola]|uniref:Uncharacterized protein n=1 Tax=Candidatus Similichlamydia laticola TaxID=2170265 RepID=A0A369KEB6_9BACT|nr:hypothetical protein [Candidatus Similichlamydia laticola]RDB31800.1 hypothetical protein HAT2_00091 [Candidatus Similichlamydia laticola]